jgi:hypothetical protein
MNTPRNSATPNPRDPRAAQRRARAAILIVFAVIALAVILAGCGVEPGRVTSTWISCTGKPVHCTPWMSTKTSDGSTTQGPVTWKEYMRCKRGEQYPACARKGGGR